MFLQNRTGKGYKNDSLHDVNIKQDKQLKKDRFAIK